MFSDDVIPPRVRTVAYVVLAVAGVVLVIGWDLLADGTGAAVLGRIAAVVMLVVGALAFAYRPTRPEPGVFQAGEAGGVRFDPGDAQAAQAALAEMERGEGVDEATKN